MARRPPPRTVESGALASPERLSAGWCSDRLQLDPSPAPVRRDRLPCRADQAHHLADGRSLPGPGAGRAGSPGERGRVEAPSGLAMTVARGPADCRTCGGCELGPCVRVWPTFHQARTPPTGGGRSAEEGGEEAHHGGLVTHGTDEHGLHAPAA